MGGDTDESAELLVVFESTSVSHFSNRVCGAILSPC